jgi:hypothetical protein
MEPHVRAKAEAADNIDCNHAEHNPADNYASADLFEKHDESIAAICQFARRTISSRRQT